MSPAHQWRANVVNVIGDEFMPNLVDKFESLGIDDCWISELRVQPRRTITVEIREEIIPPEIPSKNAINLCELQFYRVLDSIICARATPWFELITEHRAYADSDYLLERLARHKVSLDGGDDFFHFVVNFEKGKFDIIAEQFTFCKIERMPIGGGEPR